MSAACCSRDAAKGEGLDGALARSNPSPWVWGYGGAQGAPP